MRIGHGSSLPEALGGYDGIVICCVSLLPLMGLIVTLVSAAFLMDASLWDSLPKTKHQKKKTPKKCPGKPFSLTPSQQFIWKSFPGIDVAQGSMAHRRKKLLLLNIALQVHVDSSRATNYRGKLCSCLWCQHGRGACVSNLNSLKSKPLPPGEGWPRIFPVGM